MNACPLPECQTTAGCAHRSPGGIYCSFTRADMHRLTREVEELRRLLAHERQRIEHLLASIHELYLSVRRGQESGD
jgi:hypothetical protein